MIELLRKIVSAEINSLSIQEIEELVQSSQMGQTIKNKRDSAYSFKSGLHSKKLAAILKNDCCAGDFCSLVFGNYEKGGLEELQSKIKEVKELANIMTEDFARSSFEISSNLVSRARDLNPKAMGTIMQKHRISGWENTRLQQQKQPMIIHKNEYRTVKVCRNCYIFYSLLIKELDWLEQQKSHDSAYFQHEFPPRPSPKPALSTTLSTDFPAISSTKNLKNTFLGLGFPAECFSLKRRFFYPRSQKVKTEAESQGSMPAGMDENRSVNLFRNTIMTRRGEVALSSMYLERPTHDGAVSTLIRSPNRESLFGNPQRKSFLFAVF